MDSKDKLFWTTLIIKALHVLCAIIVLSTLLGSFVERRGGANALNVDIFSLLNVALMVFLLFSALNGINRLNDLMSHKETYDDSWFKETAAKSKSSLVLLTVVVFIYLILLTAYPFLRMIW
jgi:hypothetical protein